MKLNVHYYPRERVNDPHRYITTDKFIELPPYWNPFKCKANPLKDLSVPGVDYLIKLIN